MKIKHLPYPDAERTEVVDNYFGTEVADPYRWLEDDRSEQTAAWVAAENAVTQNYLDQIPFRDGDACPPDRAVGLSLGGSSG